MAHCATQRLHMSPKCHLLYLILVNNSSCKLSETGSDSIDNSILFDNVVYHFSWFGNSFFRFFGQPNLWKKFLKLKPLCISEECYLISIFCTLTATSHVVPTLYMPFPSCNKSSVAKELPSRAKYSSGNCNLPPELGAKNI